MARQQLIKHGTNAGYRAEVKTYDVCERCRNAHRVYATQHTKAGKLRGIRYGEHEVIDHLYSQGTTEPRQSQGRRRPGRPGSQPAGYQPDSGASPHAEQGMTEPEQGTQSQPGPSLAERLSSALFTARAERQGNDYLETDEYPGYISASDPDPEPGTGDWSQVRDDDEFVVTAEGIKAIKDNLGFYLVTAGMTLELIDPYCGTALRDNVDDIVSGWAKVISRYPSAAKMLMAKGGGKIMAWIDALMATWPVLLAIYEHHLSKTVQIDSLGQAVRVNRSANGQGNSDPNMPPMPGYDYRID